MVENEVQVAALVFLAVVYAVRLLWLLRFRSGKERTMTAGSEGEGIRFSLMNVAMPWAMESTRRKPGIYVQFVVFHLGVVAAIAATFIIPYAPAVFESQAIVLAFQAALAAAFLVGLIRLIRRLKNPVVRLVSSADDFLSSFSSD